MFKFITLLGVAVSLVGCAVPQNGNSHYHEEQKKPTHLPPKYVKPEMKKPQIIHPYAHQASNKQPEHSS